MKWLLQGYCGQGGWPSLGSAGDGMTRPWGCPCTPGRETRRASGYQGKEMYRQEGGGQREATALAGLHPSGIPLAGRGFSKHGVGVAACSFLHPFLLQQSRNGIQPPCDSLQAAHSSCIILREAHSSDTFITTRSVCPCVCVCTCARVCVFETILF